MNEILREIAMLLKAVAKSKMTANETAIAELLVAHDYGVWVECGDNDEVFDFEAE